MEDGPEQLSGNGQGRMIITYTTYQLASGEGPQWMAHCLENGKSRLVFFGETEAEAMGKAKTFANTYLDTPERRAMLKERAEARAKAAKARKAKEVA